MACSIVITDVKGTLPELTIIVTGTAVDCNGVKVTLSCVGEQGSFPKTVPVTAGKWEAKFENSETEKLKCACGGQYSVTAECVDDPTCSDSRSNMALVCEGTECPAITLSHNPPDLSKICADPGVATIIFNTRLTPPISGCNFHWNIIHDMVMTSLPSGPSVTLNLTEPGHYTLSLTLICNGNFCENKLFDFDVQRCCPIVTDIEHNPQSEDECADETTMETAKWLFNVIMDPPHPAGTYLWNFGDGTTEPGPQLTSHEYKQPGSYLVTVTFTPDASEFPDCAPLPPFTDPDPVVVARCDKGGNGNGGDNGCSWWDPGCWSDPCAALLGLAMLSLLAAATLSIIAGCTGSSILWGIAGGSFVLSLILFGFWLGICSETPDFCKTLHQVIAVLAVIDLAAALAAGVLAALHSPCFAGVAAAFAEVGVVLASLVLSERVIC